MKTMNTADIIKAREGLCKLLELALNTEGDDWRKVSSDARESLAAFERLIAEPTPAPPQMPLRAYIVTQLLLTSQAFSPSAPTPSRLAETTVQLADALIERLKRP